MRTFTTTNRYEKDVKLSEKRNLDLSILFNVLEYLEKGEPLPPKYKDHNLIGNFKGCRECHISPDWLLIYEISEDNTEVILRRTGTHSDLF